MTIEKRYDFVYLFDVKDGNPNGDPDAGNLPRTDPETGHGLVTDVCIKRKVRNYVHLVKASEPERFDIYVKEKAVLNLLHEQAYEVGGAVGVDDARQWMCGRYFDVRTFGAVMSTGKKNCGQVRGPIQMTFSRSADQIVSLEHSITRMAVTTEAEAEKQKGDNRTMGRKYTVPYGLYRCHGFISAPLARQTGFDAADLDLFWSALTNMFEHDRSAARGEMTPRKLVVFEHESELGNAPSHKLFERVTVSRAEGSVGPVRKFSDYRVEVDAGDMPAGVTIRDML